MGIFLRHSYNVKPPRWGSPADVQYAIRVNSEKIYGIDPDNDVLVMPNFWGLPLLDYSKYGNDGTNYGATYKDGSLDFNGSSNYVNIADSPELGTTAALTVSVWFKSDVFLDMAASTYRMLEKGNSYFFLQHAPYGGMNFLVKSSGTSYFVGLGQSLNANQCYYIVGTFNSNDDAKVYLDGVLKNTIAVGGDIDDANLALRIGSDDSGFYFDGLIDEVRISNTARTANQIALFNDLPWDLYRPVSRPVYFFQAAAGAYTITADSGSYIETGAAANLLKANKISAGLGSYALTGIAANLLKGYKVDAAAGAYALAGQTIALVKTHKLSAGSGSYAETGIQVNLLKNSKIPAGSGAYALTGQAAGLIYSGGPSFTVSCYTLPEDPLMQIVC